MDWMIDLFIYFIPNKYLSYHFIIQI